MRKFLLLAFAMIAFAVSSASAQIVESSRFFDNWSLGLKGGAVTPMNHAAFWGDMRGVVGLEVEKKITPVIGFGVEGQWSVNTSSWRWLQHSTTAFDHQLVGGFITTNLMNLFGGYQGTPRTFEIVANVGLGWLHAYGNGWHANSWYTKFGPDFNFNLGKAKAWTIGVKPAFVYDMTGNGKTNFNINRGFFEILGSITYHFKNKNGTHSFVIHDDSELYDELAWLTDANKNMAERIAWLENQPPQVQIVEKVVEVENVVEPVTVIGNAIGFNLNSSEILPTNFASLENVANILKEDRNLKLNVVGFASAKEGTPSYNEVLSLRRAIAVKDVLVNTFGIDANRLTTVGKGCSVQLWKENDWNRTVIFEVVE